MSSRSWVIRSVLSWVALIAVPVHSPVNAGTIETNSWSQLLSQSHFEQSHFDLMGVGQGTELQQNLDARDLDAQNQLLAQVTQDSQQRQQELFQQQQQMQQRQLQDFRQQQQFQQQQMRLQQQQQQQQIRYQQQQQQQRYLLENYRRQQENR